MLIRLVDHFRDNPKRIDKLIAIKGLPDDWIFYQGPHGTELRKPWEPDIEKNIPTDIRHLCEPMYVIQRFRPIQTGQAEVIEKRQIIGIRIDYNSEPGRQLWDDIERFVEESLPRNERIPIPVLCSKDERSSFETFTPRRTARGSLELIPSPVPLVDLTQYVAVKIVEKPVEIVSQGTIPEAKIPDELFKCEECDYQHRSKAGVRMHKVKRHPAKQKVEVA